MMRLDERRPPAGWWWVFVLLIAAPAAALAVLGASTWRADEIERQHALQQQKARTTRLIELALSDVVSRARQTSAIAFEVDTDLTVSFPQQRVHTGTPAFGPILGTSAGAEHVALAERAREAHLQGRVAEAVRLYETLSQGTQFAEWARAQTAALVASSRGEPPYVPPLEWAGSEARTPSGVPLALTLCAPAEVATQAELRRLRPFLQRAHEALRAGRWWLSLEERRAYDEALVRWRQRAEPNVVVPADAALADLPGIAAAVTASLVTGREAFPTAEVIPDDDRLILWARPAGGRLRWSGVAVPRGTWQPAVDRALKPLVAGQPLRVAVWQGQRAVWGEAGSAVGSERVALAAFPGWTVAFDEQVAVAPWRVRAQRVGLIVAPLILLGCGLAMTAWIIRREVVLRDTRERFVAAVTHEFKSPLTSVSLLTERLVRHADPQVAEYARAMQGEAQRLGQLVDRMLEVQQLRAGRRAYVFAATDLSTLVEDVARVMQPHAEARGITIATRVSSGVPSLSLDRDAMRDAIRNLVDNAVKYSPSGSHVEVIVRADERHVRIEVVDQGVGVDPAEAQRIFDEFYRSRRGDDANVRGTGLGLALVKATAAAHGGDVTVDSDGQRGSRFTLTLPIEPDLARQTAAGASRLPRSAHSA